ncbi:hypothetical protein [Streptomyces sp. NBC_00582]|uniref:hypothetical protein n=1 Tax=Streptomyces sp. NBC_00582 TaxID=2975783 RepID=UPI003FCE641A
MRASLIQLSVAATDSADERRHQAASLVRARAGDDLVVLPELWAAGARSYDRWGREPKRSTAPRPRPCQPRRGRPGSGSMKGMTVILPPQGEIAPRGAGRSARESPGTRMSTP